jgi:hypothetical protein
MYPVTEFPGILLLSPNSKLDTRVTDFRAGLRQLLSPPNASNPPRPRPCRNPARRAGALAGLLPNRQSWERRSWRLESGDRSICHPISDRTLWLAALSAGLPSPPRVALGRAPLRRSSLSQVHWTCSSAIADAMAEHVRRAKGPSGPFANPPHYSLPFRGSTPREYQIAKVPGWVA